MADHECRVTFEFARRRCHAEVTCGACGWRVIFPPEAFSALWRKPLPMDMATRRLRCRRCGAKRARVRSLRREWHS